MSDMLLITLFFIAVGLIASGISITILVMDHLRWKRFFKGR